MQLDISNALKAPGVSFVFTMTESLEPMCAGGEDIRFVEPVEIGGSYVSTGENILVKGVIRADYIAQCSRCLKDVSASIRVPYSEEFARNEDGEHPDRYLYTGEKLDLRQMTEDLISLSTPMRHLCGESCKGLCPTCGADRNASDCGCSRPDDTIEL